MKKGSEVLDYREIEKGSHKQTRRNDHALPASHIEPLNLAYFRQKLRRRVFDESLDPVTPFVLNPCRKLLSNDSPGRAPARLRDMIHGEGNTALVTCPLVTRFTLRLFTFLLLIPCALFSAPKKERSSSSASAEDPFYKIVTIPVPAGIVLEAGALQVLEGGKLAVSTRL